MKAKSITVGNVYNLTLGRNEVQGEVIAETENDWEVRLLASDKVIKVNSPDRFLRNARTIQVTDEPVATIEAEPTPETQIEGVRQKNAVDIESDSSYITAQHERNTHFMGGSTNSHGGIDDSKNPSARE